ncbi:MAG: PhoH family protein [Campylobacterales bacterium]|nr:PhoH family protein [Campylobacterales bacterium]
MNQAKIYVIDTNVILQNIQNIYNLSDEGSNIVVIPETVLIELEDKKKLFNELGYQSREFARMLAKASVDDIVYKKDFKIVKLSYEKIKLHIISKEHYESEILPHNIAESNDKRIIEVAQTAKEYYENYEVTFISIDIYARTFALFKNIPTQTLHEDRSELPHFEFIKTISINSCYFNTLHLKNIEDFDQNYIMENFCYEFLSDDGNSAYGLIVDKKIHLLDDGIFKALPIKPANLKQRFFLSAILSNMYNLLVIDAKAGSGKTLMSFASAMRLIDLGAYEKIVYVRNSIESVDRGAEVGFLSGNDEKFRIYNMALYDTLEFIAKKKLKNSQNQTNQESIKSKSDELIDRYNIETLWPGEARGRTLSNAIVILDEWQNSSENTTQLILSRLDESCMAIVIGSNRQIDNLYLNKYNNGLTTLLKQTRFEHPELKMFAIELSKSVRGKFAQFTERIFENKRNN